MSYVEPIVTLLLAVYGVVLLLSGVCWLYTEWRIWRRARRSVVEVRTWCCGEVIATGGTLREAVLNAISANESLAYADLSGRRLIALDLKRVNLSNADLRNSDFENCSFRQANLEGAKVRGANFGGVNFSGANVIDVQLHRACMDDTTTTNMYSSPAARDRFERQADERYIEGQMPRIFDLLYNNRDGGTGEERRG